MWQKAVQGSVERQHDEDERKSREALAKKYNLTSDGDNAASDADLDSSADSNLSEDSDSSEEAGSEPTEE